MEKLIIKAVICNTRWAECPPYRMTAEETAAEAKAACDAGAAVVHYHCPYVDGKAGGLAAWQEGAKLIREACDAVIEHGSGGGPYSVSARRPIEEARKNDLRIEHKLGTEMMVTGLGMLDHVGWGGVEFGDGFGPDGIFTDESIDQVVSSNSRRNMEINCRYYRDSGVKPRLESFSTSGPFRNLEWLVKRGAIDPPYCVTMAFGATGIIGDPTDIVYLRQRIASMPENLKDDIDAEVSCYSTGASQLLLFAHAIAEGLNIRVGMEDMPFYRPGVPTTGNAQLVERVVRLAKEFDRPIADPSEARKMYKLPPLRR